ncbi:hypothetical protein P8629_05575 [Hydrogenovibrio sp. 3SP14C1]|uniref:hypothetical protein n=1 Tax=Hydrogenovibrio sp. 3SP14C1 TaxID=3038774 RepID=UPI00241713EB|nr:hypothetical protein [Hydrogenovibrio sp. 3SP14C1]MDG4812471.1 hypothetical protein [Hydrogenovibrio sp. 3SP14C1]
MIMRKMTSKDYVVAVAVGIAIAMILSMVMIPAAKFGMSSMPKPLSLAFVQMIFGEVPALVGILFHIAYVTFWTIVYVVMFKLRTFLNALWLALALWGLVLVFFFPLVGWGFFGLAVGPELIVGSLVPHLLFAVLLWAISRWAFPYKVSYEQENP